MEQFTPWELVPGYMTHQTPRNDAQGQCVRDRAFHVRDWDYLGWQYSVISSIGTAPFNHVVDLLPARDETSSNTSARKINTGCGSGWIGPTSTAPRCATCADHRTAGLGPHGRHRGDLRRPRFRVPVQSELPGARMPSFTLDASIGLTTGDRFVLRELYPRPGRLLGQGDVGPWHRGDIVSLPIKGPQAVVLEVVPAAAIQLPAVLGATGQAALDGENLTLSGLEGEMGTTAALSVLLPPARRSRR